MARARNIKPSITRNEDLADLDPLYRIGFIYSWMFADVNGVIEYRPKRLKTDLFPYDEIDLEIWLTELAKKGFVALFVYKGRRYFKVLNFQKHQNPHKQEREAGSDLPDISTPEVSVISTVEALPNYFRITSEVNVLIPDSLLLIPDSLLLIPDSTEPQAAACVPDDPKTDLPLEEIFLGTVIAGISERLDLKTLSTKLDWEKAGRWAIANDFTADHFLECFELLQKQHWRYGPVKPSHVTENLPNLKKLRDEIAKNAKRNTDQNRSDELDVATAARLGIT